MAHKRSGFKQQNRLVGTVKCECGKEILLVPDLKAMANALEAHVLEHCKKEKDPTKAACESDRLWNLLLARVFEKVAPVVDGIY
jgi:hypothetical protein